MAGPKRRGRPPRVKTVDVTPIEEPKPVEKTYEAPMVSNAVPCEMPTRDAILEVDVKIPGFPMRHETILIRDIVGNSLGSQRRPENFAQIIKTALRSKFNNVI